MGKCGFLGPKGCMLPREDMPLGCTTVYGCEPNRKQASSLFGGTPIIIAWKSKHGRAVMKAFEQFHIANSLNVSVGYDALFAQEHALYTLGLEMEAVMISEDIKGSNNLLDYLPSFLKVFSPSSCFSKEQQRKCTNFIRWTFALKKSRFALTTTTNHRDSINIVCLFSFSHHFLPLA